MHGVERGKNPRYLYQRFTYRLLGKIPQFEKLIATIRSREISASIILQSRSQLKALYKDHAETILGNTDSTLFLGGREATTLKDLSTLLGSETIKLYNLTRNKGSQESAGINYQKLGKKLLTEDELAVMDGGKCIYQLRGVRPFLSDKYPLEKHPNFKYTADYSDKNYFDVKKHLNTRLNLKSTTEVELIKL